MEIEEWIDNFLVVLNNIEEKKRVSDYLPISKK